MSMGTVGGRRVLPPRPSGPQPDALLLSYIHRDVILLYIRYIRANFGLYFQQMADFGGLRKMFGGIPLPIFQIYFNYHFENSCFFTGDLDQVWRLVEVFKARFKTVDDFEEISVDTYLKLPLGTIFSDLVSLRIRRYLEGKDKDIVDLIALIKSEAYQEDVLVARISITDQNNVSEKILTYLGNYGQSETLFEIQKRSRQLVFQKPEVSNETLVGAYLTVSFDGVDKLKILDEYKKPDEIFGYNRIVEVEWNKDADETLVNKIFEELKTNPVSAGYCVPKTEKKSVIIERWVKGNRRSNLV